MSKQKSTDDGTQNHLSMIELDEEQIAALELMKDNTHPHLQCLVPILDSIRKAYSDKLPPHRRALPVTTIVFHDWRMFLMFWQTRPATDFKRTTAVAQALDIDYKEDDMSYVFKL